MQGCTGAEPPAFDPLDEGTPCNRSGVCEDNRLGGTECSVLIPSACRFGMSRNAKFFCEAGEEFGMDFCEFFVEVPGGGRTVCEDFCAELGMTICDQNNQEACCWNNDNPNDCERLQGISCRGTPCNDHPDGCTDMICRCYIPEE